MCVCVCIVTYGYTVIHVSMSRHMHVCVCVCVCVYIHIHTYLYIVKNIYIYIHIYIYMYIYFIYIYVCIYSKCPLILGSDLLPKRSWEIRRSTTKDTGPSTFARLPGNRPIRCPHVADPASCHLLRFHFGGYAKEVCNLINRPVA